MGAPGAPLSAELDAAADELDVPATERDAFAAAALPVIRRLLELGFVEVVEPG